MGKLLNPIPEFASALDLATSARVACAMLEGQLDRRAYKKAASTNRKLWDRINAMACRIEDLQAEVERLQTPAAVAVTVVEAEDPVVEISEEAPAPAATVTLGSRPPGFDRVRSRMRDRESAFSPDRRGRTGIEAIKAARSGGGDETEATDRPKREGSPKPKTSAAKPWMRLIEAVEAGRIEIGREYRGWELRGLVGQCDDLSALKLSLSINHAAYQIANVEGGGTYVVLPAAI